jgi:hypothetical protein
MTCMTPRALALETIALLNPLSCQAIAAASEPGTPCWPATDVTVPASTRVPLTAGAALGTVVAGAAGPPVLPVAAATAAGGSLIDVPASSGRLEAQAVDAGDLLRRGAGLGGQAGEGVAGLTV